MRFFLDIFDELSDFGSCESSIFSFFGALPIAWHDWSTTLVRVKLTKMIEMDTVQNASNCNRHRVEVWMLILAFLTLRLIF